MSEPVTPRVKPLPDGLLSVLVGFSAPNVVQPLGVGRALWTPPRRAEPATVHGSNACSATSTRSRSCCLLARRRGFGAAIFPAYRLLTRS